MHCKLISIVATASALGIASSAWAASDYLLEIDGIDGAAPSSVEVMSWSFGTSNPTMTGPAGQGRLRESPTKASTGKTSGMDDWSPPALRESPTRASTGKTARVATGDVSGDSMPDIITVAAQDEVRDFSLTLDRASPIVARYCATGQHIPSGRITRAGAALYEFKDAIVSSCAATPSRMSTNMTMPRQTQGASFGERCADGHCQAATVTMVLTGQLKHTKTGHVTLMK